jgi:hypothetical protein
MQFPLSPLSVGNLATAQCPQDIGSIGAKDKLGFPLTMASRKKKSTPPPYFSENPFPKIKDNNPIKKNKNHKSFNIF